MTYAPAHRPFYDADSHIMELPDVLRDYTDPAIREQIPQVTYEASLVTDQEVGVIVANDVREQFYAENFLRIFPDARVH